MQLFYRTTRKGNPHLKSCKKVLKKRVTEELLERTLEKEL